MIFVVDVEGGRADLVAGRLACPEPACAGVLRPWASARTRRLRGPGGRQVQVTPDRGRCRVCRHSHVLLPAFAVPRRAYTAEVIGAALRAGPGSPPAAVPATTARRWRRAVRRGSRVLVRRAGAVAAAFGACVVRDGPQHPAACELAAALDALGIAAAALTTGMPVPEPEPSTPVKIDYLGLLSAAYRRELVGGLRLADPHRAGRLAPWPAVNIVTGGRLLTTPSG